VVRILHKLGLKSSPKISKLKTLMKIRVLELPSNNTVLAINIPTPSMQRKIW
jgi:hypothetical protein